jgi:hypothetical protein
VQVVVGEPDVRLGAGLVRLLVQGGRPSVVAQQVVKPESARCRLQQQVDVEQVVEQLPRFGAGDTRERGRRVGVEVVCRGITEQPEHLSLRFAERAVRQQERGFDAAVPDVQFAQPLVFVTQPVRQMCHGPRWVCPRLGRGDPDSQRQEPAQSQNLGDGVVLCVDRPAVRPSEQCCRVRIGEDIE